MQHWLLPPQPRQTLQDVARTAAENGLEFES
jgi:hypothetical protein